MLCGSTVSMCTLPSFSSSTWLSREKAAKHKGCSKQLNTLMTHTPMYPEFFPFIARFMLSHRPASMRRTTQGKKGRCDRGHFSKRKWMPSGANSLVKRSKINRPTVLSNGAQVVAVLAKKSINFEVLRELLREYQIEQCGNKPTALDTSP